MTKYTSTLLRHYPVAERSLAFEFEKPEGFAFQAGQALELTLAPGAAESVQADRSHVFSIVSAPHEPTLTIATRMRDSAFKQALDRLKPGAQVGIDGPTGSLVLDEDMTRAAVLIAGGIGITPFVSMLRDAAARGFERDIRLLYANRRPEDAAFLDELQLLEQSQPQFQLIATLTGMANSVQAWAGSTGRINEALVMRAADGLHQPMFYVVGPPMMVEDTWDLLVEDMGIDEDDVCSEGFTGY